MTISNSIRKTETFVGAGLTSEFPFDFKVFVAADLELVLYSTATGLETIMVLTTEYTVSLNPDQNEDAGGSVTLVSPLAIGYTLTITSKLDYLQSLDLTNQGGFYPTVINDALDRLTIQNQQLNEQVSRSAKVPISSASSADDLVSSIILVSEDIANIDIVAGNMADVSAVGFSIVDVQTAAENILDIHNFADVYYGASASDPTTRKDSTPLESGDLYFNTAENKMRVYTTTGWQDTATAVPISVTTQTFNGNSSTTVFTLSGSPPFLAALEVFVGGVRQIPTTDYSLAGTTLTFVAAPTTGTNNIFCRWASAYSFGVPEDGSVTPDKLSYGHPTWDNGGILTATGFSGDLTGNVTGDVTGNVTGDVTGDLTGSLLAGGSLTLATAKSATGTSIDFDSIPSWVKKITIMFSGVSTNGTSIPFVQLGDAGGIETTGYESSGVYLVGSPTVSVSTAGLLISGVWAASIIASGVLTLAKLDASSNTWVMSGSMGMSSLGAFISSGGGKTLSAVLTSIRITTVGGANTFDAGTINLMYEG